MKDPGVARAAAGPIARTATAAAVAVMKRPCRMWWFSLVLQSWGSPLAPGRREETDPGGGGGVVARRVASVGRRVDEQRAQADEPQAVGARQAQSHVGSLAAGHGQALADELTLAASKAEVDGQRTSPVGQAMRSVTRPCLVARTVRFTIVTLGALRSRTVAVLVDDFWIVPPPFPPFPPLPAPAAARRRHRAVVGGDVSARLDENIAYATPLIVVVL